MVLKDTKFKFEDFSIPSSDGSSSIFVRQFYRGEAKLHFLIVHGALEHSGRHMDLVHFLLKKFQHVRVTIFDHLGHGRSGGVRAYVNNFSHYLEDFFRVGKFLTEKNLIETKTFVLAHSLGGLITLTSVLAPDFGFPCSLSGMIFSSPCIRPKNFFAPLSNKILDQLNKNFPKIHLPLIHGGKDLTRDIDRANDFDTDSLIPKFITARMAQEVLSASEKIKGQSYYLKIPSLFLVSLADKVVEPESTLLFAQGINKDLVKIIEYPDHYHELWNEIDRENIFATVKSWVDSQLKERS